MLPWRCARAHSCALNVPLPVTVPLFVTPLGAPAAVTCQRTLCLFLAPHCIYAHLTSLILPRHSYRDSVERSPATISPFYHISSRYFHYSRLHFPLPHHLFITSCRAALFCHICAHRNAPISYGRRRRSISSRRPLIITVMVGERALGCRTRTTPRIALSCTISFGACYLAHHLALRSRHKRASPLCMFTAAAPSDRIGGRRHSPLPAHASSCRHRRDGQTRICMLIARARIGVAPPRSNSRRRVIKTYLARITRITLVGLPTTICWEVAIERTRKTLIIFLAALSCTIGILTRCALILSGEHALRSPSFCAPRHSRISPRATITLCCSSI